MSTRFIVLASTVAQLAIASSAAGLNPSASVQVIVEAEVPPLELEHAERLAGDILQQAGVSVQWVADPLLSRGPLIVMRILNKPLPRTRGLAPSTLGLSLIGTTGKHAAVFWEQTQRVAQGSNTPRAVVLACGLTHEIGHLLLESRDHSLNGLMRSVLTQAELRLAAQGQLKFSTTQATRIQEKLSRSAPRDSAMDRPSATRFDRLSIP